METKKITNAEDFMNTIHNGLTLVDFNAPWCGPCRAQEPIIHQLSVEYQGRVHIAEINVDENQETAAKLGIQSIPTLTLFREGKELQRFVGLQPKSTLAEALESALNG
jgi:thioredoxin 1